uniref:Secreted protein n=1 Tax=Populus trichocarpa TaxID=3694 RepID=A0A3N7FS32_POPTR
MMRVHWRGNRSFIISLELSLCCLIVGGHTFGFDNEQRTWLPCFLPSFLLSSEAHREKHFISLKKKKKKLSS